MCVCMDAQSLGWWDHFPMKQRFVGFRYSTKHENPVYIDVDNIIAVVYHDDDHSLVYVHSVPNAFLILGTPDDILAAIAAATKV
jgi:hypothetical protein